jgi:hypothetical protein
MTDIHTASEVTNGARRKSLRILQACFLVLLLLPACSKEKPAAENSAKPLTVDMSSGLVRLTVTVEPPDVHLSRNTLLTIEAAAPTGVEVTLPPLTDRVQGFLVSDANTVTVPGAEETVLRTAAILIPLVAEEYRIAPMAVRWTDKRSGGAREEWFPTRAVVIPSAHNISQSGSFSTLADPFWIAPSFRTVALWIISALAIAGLIYLIWRQSRRIRKKIRLMMMSPRERAMEELAELLRQKWIESNRVKDFYVELTFIVRRYIERAYRIRAPEQTTDEFLRTAGSDNRFPAATLSKLQQFLGAADLVKYAAYQPDRPTIDHAVDTARTYIGTDPGDQPQKGADNV